MINKEFLSRCTDRQINRGVAWILASNMDFSNNNVGFYEDCDIGVIWHYEDTGTIKKFNPCSNPNDIMLIMFNNGLQLMPVFIKSNRLWRAMSQQLQYSVNENPLRAICECYILMNVNK